MSYAKQLESIKKIACSLLESAQVESVVGLVKNEDAGRPTPFVAKTKEQVELFDWNDECYTNLAFYLLDLKGKNAIVAKPCDARAIVNLVAENQISRENVVIIGVECEEMKKDGKAAAGCAACASFTPVLFDHLVALDGSDKPCGKVKTPEKEGLSDWLMNSDAAERHARMQKELDKCILCYACRQACPGCYCKTCYLDRNMTNWQPQGVDNSTKMMFHLTRTMHLAGRCIECGACQKVCPGGVNIKYLIDGVNEFVEELYDFKAGIDSEARPVMSNYSADDREVGFLGGECDGR